MDLGGVWLAMLMLSIQSGEMIKRDLNMYSPIIFLTDFGVCARRIVSITYNFACVAKNLGR